MAEFSLDLCYVVLVVVLHSEVKDLIFVVCNAPGQKSGSSSSGF